MGFVFGLSLAVDALVRREVASRTVSVDSSGSKWPSNWGSIDWTNVASAFPGMSTEHDEDNQERVADNARTTLIRSTDCAWNARIGECFAKTGSDSPVAGSECPFESGAKVTT